MKVPNFYGKEIGELSIDERQLLTIDNMLLLSFRLREDGNTINFGGIDLGSDKSIAFLSKERFEQHLKLIGLDSEVKPSRELMNKMENTRYSFSKFMKDYMTLGNTISNFIDEEMVKNDDNVFNKICLN